MISDIDTDKDIDIDREIDIPNQSVNRESGEKSPLFYVGRKCDGLQIRFKHGQEN